MRKAALALIVLFGVLPTASAAQVAQADPVIASDGTGFLAVWLNEITPSAGSGTLVASRVSRSGDIIDQPEITIATGRVFGYSIAFGESSYLIVWSDGVYVYARRFSPAGTFVDPVPIVVNPNADSFSGGGMYPTAAWNGKAFLIAWYAPDLGRRGIYGALLSEDATVSSIRQISSSDGLPLHLAWNGQRMLLIWSGAISCDPLCYSGPFGIAMARLASDGTPIDTTPQYPRFQSRYADAVHIGVACDGTDFLVVYDQVTGGTAAFTVSVDGDQLQMREPQTILSWFTPPASDVAFDGRGYVVALRYSTLVPFEPIAGHDRSWLGVAHLSRDGSVTSREVVPLDHRDKTSVPQIAANSLGDSVVVLAQFSSPDGVARTRTHVPSQMKASPAPPGAPQVISAMSSGTSTHVVWTSEADAEGFVIDSVYDFGGSPVLVTDGSSRSVDVPNRIVGRVAVRAFNSGGVSIASQPVPVSATRRRAARP